MPVYAGPFYSYARTMDAVAEKKSRNSRWSRDPVMGQDGAPLAAYPTERDIEIFKLLARFHYLPSDYIHAFVGGNQKALLHRLNLLSRKPNLYLARPPQQRQCADANYRPLTYALDERGARALRERDLPVPLKSSRHNFIHELMIAQIAASIELGTRANPAVRLITWRDILANPNTPAPTVQLPIPNAVPISYSFRGEICSDQIIADARPFGLERMIDGKRSFFSSPASRPIAAPSRWTPPIPSAPPLPRNSPLIWPLPTKAFIAPTSAFPISLSRLSPRPLPASTP